jgi:Cytochrome P450
VTSAQRLSGRSISTAAAATLAGAVATATLPRWLPARVVSLRMKIFTRINGDEGIAIPGPLVGAERFKELYSHPAANGRSRGAGLSDLFWYWLSPGPEIHQEHLEPGERYKEVARTTRRVLSLRAAQIENLASRYAAEGCAEIGETGRKKLRVQAVRLRDLMMPIWAGVFSELVFGVECSSTTRDLIVANANDVVTSLKGCGLRHMKRRDRLTKFLIDHLDEIPHALPSGLSRSEQALYLQGTFFNTAIVQMSEAMAHLLMVLAHHQDIQATLASHPDDQLHLDHVMDETMRLYPLFGIAHRITSDAIPIDDEATLPAGSVLCFNYPDFHKTGFQDAEHFDPGRWERLSARDANHIPFGVAANRPCPAWHLAPIAMRAATREILRHFSLHSSAAHTRSLPNRGPCLLVPRTPAPLQASPGLRGRHQPHRLVLALAVMRARDRWEDVWRSLKQLVLGTYMVWDARRKRLCHRHFEKLSSKTERAEQRAW